MMYRYAVKQRYHVTTPEVPYVETTVIESDTRHEAVGWKAIAERAATENTETFIEAVQYGGGE